MPKSWSGGLLPPILVVLTICATSSQVLGAAEPAENWFQDLRAFRTGVDARGNLWAWNQHASRVDLYSTPGKLVKSVEIRDVVAVDADERYGVVALDKGGNSLRVISWEGSSRPPLALDSTGKWVAWIDDHEVAVTPAFADHRVELLDLDRGVVVRRIGRATHVVPRPGATMARPTFVDYDPKHGRLYTLNSYSGSFQVFSLTGELLGQASLVNPRLIEFESWLQGVDREAKKRGEIQTPAIWYFKLAVDEHGYAWTVQDCPEKQRLASLVRIAPDGETKRFEIAASCCSRSLAIWAGRIILLKDPGAPGDHCNSIGRLPS